MAFWQLRKSLKFNWECYYGYPFAIGFHSKLEEWPYSNNCLKDIQISVSNLNIHIGIAFLNV